MAFQSKSDAARSNGSKSKGPVTPEGTARSSKNALKHGLTAQLDTLPRESQEVFDALLDSHMTRYQPVGAIEEDLVQTLAITRWRLRRIPALEFGIFDNETVRLEERIDREFSEITDLGRLAYAFHELADNSKSLALLIRYEASLIRTHDRVFKHLTAIQKLRNEPNGGASFFSLQHRLQPMSSPASTPAGQGLAPPSPRISKRQPPDHDHSRQPEAPRNSHDRSQQGGVEEWKRRRGSPGWGYPLNLYY
jgi:hypothetical protein